MTCPHCGASGPPVCAGCGEAIEPPRPRAATGTILLMWALTVMEVYALAAFGPTVAAVVEIAAISVAIALLFTQPLANRVNGWAKIFLEAGVWAWTIAAQVHANAGR